MAHAGAGAASRERLARGAAAQLATAAARSAPRLRCRAAWALRRRRGAAPAPASRTACARRRACRCRWSWSATCVAGGAGKTPTVIALVALLRARGYAPGIVSRGYGRGGTAVVASTPTRRAAQVGDEPLLLRRRTGAPVVVGADRVAAATRCCGPSRGRRARQRRRPAAPAPSRATSRSSSSTSAAPATAGCCRPARCASALPARLGARQLVLYNAAAATTPLPGFVARRSLAGVVALADWWAGAAPSAGRARRACAVARSSPSPAWRGPSASSRCCAAHGLAIVERAARRPRTTSRACPGRRDERRRRDREGRGQARRRRAGSARASGSRG